jgi:membrane fusion protein, copper/silver efflux system
MSKQRGVLWILWVAALLGGVGLVAARRAQAPMTAEAAVYYCPMHPTYTSPKPGSCPICNMALVKRASEAAPAAAGSQAALTDDLHAICYLHNCPMHREGKPCPMTVVAKPGEKVTCPYCGTHVAGEEGKTQGMVRATPDGYASILLSPQKQQLIGVITSVVESREVSKSIRAVGTIAHDPELYQAQAEYIQAMQTLEQAQANANVSAVSQAQRMVDSTRIRLRHLGLSDALIDEMATWQEPEHGLLFSHPGDPVWMYAQVYEYELPYIRVGQTLGVEAPAAQGRRFSGIVRAIDQMVEPSTRTTRIRARLEDPEGFLRPDMYVNASIDVNLGQVVAVPSSAVFDTGAKRIVFVQKDPGLFEPREVELGARGDGFYEVRAGVAAGETVVTSGNFLIDSESRLKGALQGAAPSDVAEPQQPEHRHGP